MIVFTCLAEHATDLAYMTDLDHTSFDYLIDFAGCDLHVTGLAGHTMCYSGQFLVVSDVPGNQCPPHI